MSKPQITYQLAMAASHDAGNRSMRKDGRTVWAVKDWNVACETLERLWPNSPVEAKQAGRPAPRAKNALQGNSSPAKG